MSIVWKNEAGRAELKLDFEKETSEILIDKN